MHDYESKAQGTKRPASTSVAQRKTVRSDAAGRKEASHGLPSALKAGVEALSGMAMDHVKVQRNSVEPGRIGAAAFARGAEIHVGPGQEKHLPHEAWHVVQQAQGRVSPTTRVGDTAVNDDPRLEREATQRGEQAAREGDRAGSERANAPAVAAAGTASVAQCAIRLGLPGAYHWFTDDADVDAAGKKLGASPEAIAAAKKWLRDGLTHEFADWADVFDCAERGDPRVAVPGAPPPPGNGAIALGAAANASPAPAKRAPSSSSSSSTTYIDPQDHSDRIARGREKLRSLESESSSSSTAAKPVKLAKTSIRYSEAALKAAGTLKLPPKKLETRNPHDAKGTGQSGTDHQAADGRAATHVANAVGDAIEKRTGVRQKPADFLKGKEKAEAASAARSEKAAATVRKQIAADEKDAADLRSWIAHLASQSPAEDWRKQQEAFGNEYYIAELKSSRLRALRTKAKENGWPQEGTWDPGYAHYIQS